VQKQKSSGRASLAAAQGICALQLSESQAGSGPLTPASPGKTRIAGKSEQDFNPEKKKKNPTVFLARWRPGSISDISSPHGKWGGINQLQQKMHCAGKI